jgi:allophanate hydrolase
MTEWITRVDPGAWPVRDGPLRGVPFAIKDNLDLAGVPTTAACPDLAGKAAATSAVAVQRLIDAGAVPVGKTNMDQFATGLVGTRSPYGAPRSVLNPERISGGSSSGSAVAVASGQVPLALGTDTAGSGRVPAAFNGLVGVKPTCGLISTRGLLPACRSLDCVTTLTRSVADAVPALDVLADFDPADPWSRQAVTPPGVARRLRVLGVPAGELDLSAEYAPLWKSALEHAASVAAHVVEVDISPFLETAALLYSGPWIAERWECFGELLGGPGVDPVVRSVVQAGRDVTGAQVFAGLDRLAALRRATEPVWQEIDALLLPVAPFHPTFAEVGTDPFRINSMLGTYTNFVNLLDLCGVAVPGTAAGGATAGGGMAAAFGVQLIAPAFADRALLDLASRWLGEGGLVRDVPGRRALAVCGAHMSGMPLNGELLALGGRLAFRARTGPGYRFYLLPGGPPLRPGLVRTAGEAEGIALEVWDLPESAFGALAVRSPLTLGPVALDDGTVVTGFVASDVSGGTDITGYGGWRGYLRYGAGALRHTVERPVPSGLMVPSSRRSASTIRIVGSLIPGSAARTSATRKMAGAWLITYSRTRSCFVPVGRSAAARRAKMPYA